VGRLVAIALSCGPGLRGPSPVGRQEPIVDAGVRKAAAGLVVHGGEGRALLVPVAPVNAPIWSFRAHESGFIGVTFDPDGGRIFTTGLDQKLHSWDVRKRQLLDTIDFAPGMDYPQSVAVGKDGRTIFVGTTRGQVVRLERAP
jgi:WD40 repeat protein